MTLTAATDFFFVNGMYYNLKYIIGSWKLGFWEIGAKLFVWQEVYETLLYLLAPFVLPISLIVRPAFCSYLTAATFVLYYVNVTVSGNVTAICGSALTRADFQRDTSPTAKRADRVGDVVCVLRTLQDCTHMYQHRIVLLGSVQVCPVLRQEVSQITMLFPFAGDSSLIVRTGIRRSSTTSEQSKWCSGSKKINRQHSRLGCRAWAGG